MSVLFGTDVDEWRRGWRATVSGEPRREAVVSVADLTRGAAASSTQVFPDRELAYTQLDRPVDPNVVGEVVEEYLSGSTGEVTVLVDDLASYAADAGDDAAITVLDELLVAAETSGASVSVGFSVTPATVSSVSAVTGRVGSVAVPESVDEAVVRLREDDPTTFGHLRRHWREVGRALAVENRNYAQAKQLHAALGETEMSTRSLGMALSGLAEVGVIDTWGDTVGSTRYDLTGYDSVRLELVGQALDGLE
ncbi:hypothetical protein JCM17823_00010 [Halorubrum gandharaense]